MRRKQLLLIAGIFIALMAVALFFAAYLPTPSRVLKQNMYSKTFSDLRRLLSLDVIIHYETEADGTWKRGSQDRYNITILVKPTYMNESALSKVRIIYWEVGDPLPISSGAEYLPAESTPIDFGIDLMGFWANQSAWRAVTRLHQPSTTYYPPVQLGQNDLTYHFLIREILTDGASNIFNIGDFLSIAISR